MKYLSLMLLLVTLSGCELVPISQPASPGVADPDAVWAAHTAQLSALEAWKLDGRISVSFEAEAWHASMRWQQIDSVYHIRLFGPFGQGTAQLDGSPDSVILTQGDDTWQSDNAENLLLAHLGVRVPVDGLRYWVLGRAAPDSPHEVELDAAGRLAILRQAGWRIRYRGYTDNGNLQLPTKIFLDHDGLDIRLVIHSWETTGPGSG